MEPTPTPLAPESPKSNNKTIIIAVVAGLLIVCCCCLVVTVLGWTYGDALIEALGG